MRVDVDLRKRSVAKGNTFSRRCIRSGGTAPADKAHISGGALAVAAPGRLLSVRPKIVPAFATGCRHPRESVAKSGGPGPAPGLNRGRTLRPLGPWIPAFAQGCPGKLSLQRRLACRSLESIFKSSCADLVRAS